MIEPYDEFGLFHENAAEFGLWFDGAPTVRRESLEVGAGRNLSALVWGDAEPQVVLLHGGAQNAHTWDTVALALRPLPILAVDLPGHGHSDESDLRRRNKLSPTGVAEDVAVVIRKFAPTAKVIVGMSFGGLVAIALTGNAPELVRRLLLIDVLPGLKSSRSRHIFDFVNGPATFRNFQEILNRTMRFNPTRSESSIRRGILHNAVQLADGNWVWRHARWHMEEGAGVNESAPKSATLHDDLKATLYAVRVPILLARGMRPDSVLDEEDEAEFRRRMPMAQVKHFTEAGHSIQGDMPIELASTITDFIL